MTDEELAKKRAAKFYKKYAQDLKKLGFSQIKAWLGGESTVEMPTYLRKDKMKRDDR